MFFKDSSILIVQLQLEDPLSRPMYSNVPSLVILAQFLKIFVILDYDAIRFQKQPILSSKNKKRFQLQELRNNLN